MKKPKAVSLPEQLWRCLSTHLPPSTSRLCIAYSGGIDSQVLLHALVQARSAAHAPFNPTIAAIHINHGLSPHASAWEAHCRHVCSSLGVPITVCAVTPADFAPLSPEAAAREARYAAFSGVLKPGEVLILGHHVDDQLETLLQRLCRGTGVLGLGGMAVYQPNQRTFPLLRPFLGAHIDRAAIHAYAQAQELQWVEDESNQQLGFDRNFIRHEVMPVLQSRWPSAAKAAQRTAELCQEAAVLNREQACKDALHVAYVPIKHDLEPVFDGVAIGSSLSVKGLLGLSSQRRRNLLRFWLQEKGFYSPSFTQLQRIEREILGARKGVGRPQLKLRHYTIGRWRDRLLVCRATDALV